MAFVPPPPAIGARSRSNTPRTASSPLARRTSGLALHAAAPAPPPAPLADSDNESSASSSSSASFVIATAPLPPVAAAAAVAAEGAVKARRQPARPRRQLWLSLEPAFMRERAIAATHERIEFEARAIRAIVVRREPKAADA